MHDEQNDEAVLIDVVTVAVMRHAGVDPRAWLDGLEAEVATVGGRRILIGFNPGSERRQRALAPKATRSQRIDVLDVIDDDGVWRVAPSGHIAIAKGVDWLARTTLPGDEGRDALADRGAMSVRDHGLPDTLVNAMPGRPLGAVVDLAGTEGAIVETTSTEGGYLEIVVDAPWTRHTLPAWS